MRELLYLSRQKLAMFDLPGHDNRQTEWQHEVKSRWWRTRYTRSLAKGTPDELARLREVEAHLESHPIPDFADPVVRPSQWVRFDLDMGFGTAHHDRTHEFPDDVVLFVGDKGDEDRPHDVGLLLTGSVHHLRDRSVASAGRMGSGTDWMYRLITTVETAIDQDESFPEDPVRFVRERRPRYGYDDDSIADVTRNVYGVMEMYHPRRQRGRLRGLARVLLTVETGGSGTQDPTRIVVATPLYVEIVPGTRPYRRDWQTALGGLVSLLVAAFSASR